MVIPDLPLTSHELLMDNHFLFSLFHVLSSLPQSYLPGMETLKEGVHHQDLVPTHQMITTNGWLELLRHRLFMNQFESQELGINSRDPLQPLHRD